MKSRFYLALLCGACSTASQHPGSEAPKIDWTELDLHTRVSAERPWTTTKAPIVFEVQNTGAANVGFCDWQTPLEGDFRAPFLDVRGPGGSRAPYIGLFVKRATPEDGGCNRVLKPTEKLIQRLNLADGYELQPGQYSIRFVGNPFINHLPDSESMIESIDSAVESR